MEKLIIVFTMTAIMLSACSSAQQIVKQENSVNGFLYMEEVYAHAKKSFNSGNFDETIKWYDRLNEDYPFNPYAAESLFIKGYIHKTYLDDLEQAEICFKQLINNYPDSEFSNSAQFELDHLNEPDFMPNFEK